MAARRASSRAALSLPSLGRGQRRVLGAQSEVRGQPADGQQEQRRAGRRPRSGQPTRRATRLPPYGAAGRPRGPAAAPSALPRRSRARARRRRVARRSAPSPAAAVRPPAAPPAGARRPRRHRRAGAPRFAAALRPPPSPLRRPIRGADGDEHEDHGRRSRPCPSPSPRTCARRTRSRPPAARRARDGAGRGGARTDCPTAAATNSTIATTNRTRPDHAELAQHVEPLAVRVLDDAAVVAEAVVGEGERARAGARQAVIARLARGLAPELDAAVVAQR